MICWDWTLMAAVSSSTGIWSDTAAGATCFLPDPGRTGKNDNAYVEQKNNTHIRQRLGYGRYDTKEQLDAINDLYRNELRLFDNFFRPIMKIASKEKINNSVCRKKYDTAKTPYQRLLESKQISQKQKQKLTEIYLSLNPVKLKNIIDQKIKIIREMQS